MTEITVEPNIGKVHLVDQSPDAWLSLGGGASSQTGQLSGPGMFSAPLPNGLSGFPVASVTNSELSTTLVAFLGSDIFCWTDIQGSNPTLNIYSDYLNAETDIVLACAINSETIYAVDNSSNLWEINLAQLQGGGNGPTSATVPVPSSGFTILDIAWDGSFLWAWTEDGKIQANNILGDQSWGTGFVPTVLDDSETIHDIAINAIAAANGIFVIAGTAEGESLNSFFIDAGPSGGSPFTRISVGNRPSYFGQTISGLALVVKPHFSVPTQFNLYLYYSSINAEVEGAHQLRALYFSDPVNLSETQSGSVGYITSSRIYAAGDGRLYYSNPDTEGLAWIDPAINTRIFLSSKSFNRQIVLPNYNFQLSSTDSSDDPPPQDCSYIWMESMDENSQKNFLYYAPEDYAGGDGETSYDKTVLITEGPTDPGAAVSLSYYPQDGAEPDVAIRLNLNSTQITPGGMLVTEIMIDPIKPPTQ